jgi:predicted hydrocarbon binding protein
MIISPKGSTQDAFFPPGAIRHHEIFRNLFLESINTLTNQTSTPWFKLELTFDDEQGIIIDKKTGERRLIFPQAKLEQIFTRLTDLFQSSSQVIPIEAFKATGKWCVNEVPEKVKPEEAAFLKFAVQRLKDDGFGKMEIGEFKPEIAEMQFRIWNDLVAEMIHDGSTRRNLVEAYVSGFYEQLTGVTLETRKTKCVGKNDPYCEWCFRLPSNGE